MSINPQSIHDHVEREMVGEHAAPVVHASGPVTIYEVDGEDIETHRIKQQHSVGKNVPMRHLRARSISDYYDRAGYFVVVVDMEALDDG